MGLFSKNKTVEITSPAEGKIIPTSELSDPVFAEDMMGKGVAIIPTNGRFVAPFDAEVTVAFPTGHAYGLKAKNGTEVLIHIGMDTVQLEGKGFKAHVNQGDKVKKGDLLVEADLEFIKNAGKPIETPIIVTSENKDSIEIVTGTGNVNAGEVLYIAK